MTFERDLGGKEYDDRSIGSVFLPYIKGDEVWAVVKIYDTDAAKEMAEGISTSPGVVFRDPTVNDKVQLADGSKLLIEGDPSLLDHIAVVSAGVWDKGGEPSGIRADSVKENTTMADETEDEKKARKDAEGGGNIDKVLAHLDSMAKRFDNIDKRMDAMEMMDKAKKDAEEEKEKKDRKDRMDAERAEWMKADAEGCARDDAEEEKEREEHEKKGETKEAAADKARKDRKDRMDARRKDAEEKERKDAEEKARKDSQPDIQKMIADALAARLPRDRSSTERAELAAAQAQADAAYQAFGDSAPPPMQAELPADYRRRLLTPLLKHSKKWVGTELHGLSDAIFGKIEPEIYADAVTASKSDENLPAGQLIPFRRTNESGHQITEFRGRDTVFKRFSAPVMAVTEFKTAKRA